jgi:hypothetical protein
VDTQLAATPVLVDDLAVSGLTLEVARSYIRPTPQTIGVGLLYNSRATRKRIGATDIRAGMVYERAGGGRVPVNSLASLQAFPERTQALGERYFSGSQAIFQAAIATARVQS